MSRVYVGHLPPRCSERDIERFFKGYGRLRDVVLKNGYGFVEFDNEKDAEDAVYDLHGRDLHGERIVVEHARLPPGPRGSGPRRGMGYGGGGGGGGGGGERGSGGSMGNRDRRYGPPTRTEYRVVVENLSSRVSWQDLKDLMRKAGEVTYADAHKSGKNDGDMKVAIEKFHGYDLYGRRLRVYEDKQNARSRSDSRSVSGSRHRSQSVDSPRQKSRSNRRSVTRSESRSRHSSFKNSRSRSQSFRGRSASGKRSLDGSRSPSRNGRQASFKNGANRRSQSFNDSRSRSGSRALDSRSPRRSMSRSKSRSVSNRSRSGSPRRSDEEIDDRSEGRHSREHDFD